MPNCSLLPGALGEMVLEAPPPELWRHTRVGRSQDDEAEELTHPAVDQADDRRPGACHYSPQLMSAKVQALLSFVSKLTQGERFALRAA